MTNVKEHAHLHPFFHRLGRFSGFMKVRSRHARMRAGGTFDDGVMRLKFLSLRCRDTCHGA